MKGQLAVKIYGEDLKILEEKGAEVVRIMRPIRGIDDLGMLRVTGQPNLNLSVDRDAAARFQMNVADVQDAIQTAVGGNAVSQVLQGEQRYDLVARYLPRYRDTSEAIEHIRLLSPSGERVSLAQLCTFRMADGASTLYREANSRYVGVKYSVRGRDLGGAVEEAIRKVNAQVKLPPRYHLRMGGRIREPETLGGAAADHCAPHRLSDLPDHLWRFRLRQVGVPAPGQRCRRACRRPPGPVLHGHAL